MFLKADKFRQGGDDDDDDKFLPLIVLTHTKNNVAQQAFQS